MEQIRISGKNLGRLALNDSCLKCFWLQLKLGFNMPYTIFPGIFSSIDAYTKKVVQGHFDRVGAFPAWLSSLGQLSGYVEPPHHSKFYALEGTRNLMITGAPDGVFKKSDGTLMLVDYKTARYTNGQDSMLPEYEVQLNAYAWISDQCGFGKVSELKLIYFEPQTDQCDADGDLAMQPHCFTMSFVPKIVDIALQPQMLAPLFMRVREIYDGATSPESHPKCKNCMSLGKLVRLASGA